MKNEHVNGLSIAILASLAASWIIGMGAAVLTTTGLKCPPGKVCIDPVNTSCFAIELHNGWKPSSVEQRHYISAQVAQGKAEYKFQKDGIDCYARDKHFVLGERVTQLPAEWWRPKGK